MPKDTHDGDAIRSLTPFAAALDKAAKDSDEERAAASAIFDALDKFDDETQKRIMRHPALRGLFQTLTTVDEPANGDDPPGTIYYRSVMGEKHPWTKKPWTWQEAWRRFPTKTWTNVDRKVDLGWQGLLVSLGPMQEVTLPEPFHGVWQRWLIDLKDAREHAEFLFKKRESVRDDSILTAAGMQARALANHAGALNLFNPGGGVGPEDNPFGDGPTGLTGDGN